MNISGNILKEINDLGIDTKNAKFDELDPVEFLSFNDFVKKDFDSQKNEETYWSTMWPNNLDNLKIISKSSSTLKGYPVTNLFDKNPNTAWVEGVKGDGIGEWVSVELYMEKKRCPSGLDFICIVPGYLKNDKTWEENNRVKSALLICSANPKKNAILRLKFNDFKGFQIFHIGDYASYVEYYKKIWIIIEDVYKGSKYQDTCISEIVIKGIYSLSAEDGP